MSIFEGCAPPKDPALVKASARVFGLFIERYEAALDHVEVWSELALAHPDADEELMLEVVEAQECVKTERVWLEGCRRVVTDMEALVP